MQAGGEVGLFLTAIDPGIGFTFYSRQFAGLSSTHPALVVTAAPRAQPGITAASLSGTNLFLSATNGVAGWVYYVLTSTNLAVPASRWTTIATNVLSSSGNFMITVTNGANTNAVAPQFFVLRTF
jgi:hypothetical protein